VQTRKFERTPQEIKKAIRFNIIDSAIALNMAFLVNSAILILAAATFFKNGLFEVAEIQDAHKLLEPLLGTQWAPILFAIALIAAGQSSTVTGTLAGQIVMEGYLNIRLAPWLRRLITRLIAITPAYISFSVFGEGSTGNLLVLSQVILSLQLGFAIIPLIHFVSDKKSMGEFAAGTWIKILAWTSALVIVGLNVKLVIETFGEWMTGAYAGFIQWMALPLAILTFGVLVYISIKPFLKARRKDENQVPHGLYDEFRLSAPVPYRKIAVTLDFSERDHLALNHALKQGGKEAEYLLIHITESPVTFIFGKEARDLESESDRINMQKYIERLSGLGYQCRQVIGYGKPRNQIPKLVKDFQAELLVMGAHGHQTLKDILLGSTVNAVRHHVSIPVLIVR
jgi:manganese transport protein